MNKLNLDFFEILQKRYFGCGRSEYLVQVEGSWFSVIACSQTQADLMAIIIHDMGDFICPICGAREPASAIKSHIFVCNNCDYVVDKIEVLQGCSDWDGLIYGLEVN